MGEVKLCCATLPLKRYEIYEIYWGEVGTVHLSSQRNRLKKWGLWCGVMLLYCCSWMENQDCVLHCIALCKEKPGCGQLEQDPDGQEALMEVGWATSHG